MRLVMGGQFLLCVMLMMGQAAKAQQNPVVVELFTSQGCAACPPADGILETLADRSDVIALALHVDYWDYIGWTDSFGQAQFSKRQKDYARARGRASVYTPQMIIGGIDEVKGSSSVQVMGVLGEHLSANPFTAKVRLTVSGEPGAEVKIDAVAPEGLPYAAEVHLIRYKDAEPVEILAGENAGRTVTYRNVVTSWQNLGPWDGIGRFQRTVAVAGSDAVVVLVQEQGHGPIVAAARRR